MTTMGGGEPIGGQSNGPEWELVLPSIPHGYWSDVALVNVKAHIAAIKLVRARVAGKVPTPLEKGVAASLNAHVDAITGSRLSELFPPALGGKGPPPGAKRPRILWDYDRFSDAELRTVSQDGVGVPARPFDDLPGVAISASLYDSLRGAFDRGIGFSDRTGSPNFTRGPLDVGYDGKMWLTWLSQSGPMFCELWANDSFRTVRPSGAAPPPKDNVTAVVPNHDPAQSLHFERVMIVGTRAGAAFTSPLTNAAIAEDRVGGVLACDYLLRRLNETGQVDTTWGDQGHAWITHMNLRQTLRWVVAETAPSMFR